MLQTNAASESGAIRPLNFLWLELTNQCNLQCSHCYAESGPFAGNEDRLTRANYQQLIVEAYEVGCRRIQFIGGEPTLNRDLPGLIRLAANTGYTFIEVFTNLTRLSDELIRCFKERGVHVATSVYSRMAETHDGITHIPGSFEKTISNVRRVLHAGISIRVGVIEMPANAGQVETTMDFLRDLGVEDIGTDRLRHFGRGGNDGESALTELCGGCADSTLCVGADGRVSPCIMSKSWSVGSVFNTPLTELAKSERLATLRSDIYRSVVEPSKRNGADHKGIHTICTPKVCAPYETCSPKSGPGPCAPTGCNPCFPKG